MELNEEFSTVERVLLDNAQKSRTPVNGVIELLPLCNMNCDMCYVRLSREEMEKQGRLRTADEWLAIGRQMQKAGTLFLLLTGGEPLIYPDFKKLYLGLKNLGMIIAINTNGTLLDEEWADFFAENKPRRINITLYGSDERAYKELCHYPGGFEKVTHAIKLLRDGGVDVRIGGSLTKTNQTDLSKILESGFFYDAPVRVDTYMMPAVREREKPFAEQSRLDPESAAAARVQALRGEMGEELFPQYVIQSIELAENPPDYLSEPRGMTCRAGNCSFTINWQGEMRPCVVMTEPTVSVFEVGFEKAWQYVVEECGKIRLNIKCSQCNLRHLCRTCAASALLEEGSYDGVPEYMCRYAAETLRLLKEEYNRIKNI